jgi:hypothetical protein
MLTDLVFMNLQHFYKPEMVFSTYNLNYNTPKI